MQRELYSLFSKYLKDIQYNILLTNVVLVNIAKHWLQANCEVKIFIQIGFQYYNYEFCLKISLEESYELTKKLKFTKYI